MAKIEKMLMSEELSDHWDTVSKALLSGTALLGNQKLQRAVVTGTTLTTLVKAGVDWYRDKKKEETYSIRIYETDVLYDRVQQWIVASMDDAELRSVTAQAADITPYGYDVEEEEEADISELFGASFLDDSGNTPSKKTKSAIEVTYYGSRTQEIEIDGHKVSMSINNTGPGGGEDKEAANKKGRPADYIYIECDSLPAKRAVLARLEREARAITERRPRILGGMQWGNFRQLGSVPKRPISSVVLKEGQGERILNDLKDFLTREDKYALLGMPFRRGLLLEGAPGTGKSSVATALAHELKMDVYVINLSSVASDNDLLELVTDIRNGSILLLEDIDVANSVKDRTDDRPGVTMSGILNALDGIATPSGLITILTTNNVDVIDPAILRPGRVDLHEKVGYIDTYQLRGLCKTFLGFVPEYLPEVCEDDKIVAAAVVECFKRNLDNRWAAADDLCTMVTLKKRAYELEGI